ncbi:hypothetical protein K2173_001294 [Erythroxylum novogranatense]|uniref:Fibronectin type III-like domain-containing protein n=1 Tax=Erythroxylum novogranatense TaxID=1862640 RepID=A0AAV8T4R2_9ROSI|nr:hypothetical protein K2173_001294 [Erythroxylum novogranatense]
MVWYFSQAVSTEARAMFNLGRGGLTYWSPTINVVRDPRWGRITETPGEDPFVVGTYATNYVRGLQDVEGQENTTDLTSRPLKVSACCKHYTAYDVDNWNGTDRYHYDAEVTEQDMLETFLPPFEMCVKEGDSSSVMCSYNRVNGIPTCADPKLLNQTIRGEWNLRGYIVADCDSIEVMVDDHKFLGDTNEEAVARAFKAGLDLDCGDYYPKYGASAVKQGKVRVEDIDRSLIFLYILLMRVGFFDGNPKYSSLGKQDICSKQNMELAAEAARQGIVLLKNDNNTLPLNKAAMSSLAVVGPHANATLAMIGNYAFDPKNPGTPCQFSSPINGFSKFGMVTAAPGCVDVACKNNSLFSQALDAAMNSDATIIVAGLDLSVEAESLDRNDLLLPGSQTDLITQVADASEGPVILVLMTAGGVDISSSINNPKIGGILWAGYPGQDGGRAIAEVVFGLHNPGGRLPITWYPADYVKQLPLTSMPLRPTGSYPGRTYKFYNGTTIFPFGYGLSYTKFNYKHIARTSAVTIKLSRTIKCRDIDYGNNAKPTCPALLINDLKCEETILFDVQVQNAGAINGDAVLLIYSKAPDGITGAPLKQVVGFQRVFVAAGGNAMAKFELNACKSLGIVDYTGYRLLPSGINNIIIGDTGVTFPVEVIFQ